MRPFWKGLAVVSVVSTGTKIIISGIANQLKSKLKFYNLWMPDPIITTKGSLDAEL